MAINIVKLILINKANKVQKCTTKEKDTNPIQTITFKSRKRNRRDNMLRQDNLWMLLMDNKYE